MCGWVMASWSFFCKRCGDIIKHAEIPDTLWNSYYPAKPELPADGAIKRCRHCSATFTYQPYELVYERV
jgi:hypothetical protein